MREALLLALQYLCLSSPFQLHDNGTRSGVKASKCMYYRRQNSVLGGSLIEYIDIVMTEQGRKLAHQIQVFSLFGLQMLLRRKNV